MAGITSEVATTDFLNLLTVQLQNQDPIDPVKQEDFISQLSQFSMLEGIEALNSSFDSLNSSFEKSLRTEQLTQGIGLVGKQAEYLNEETGERESGRVDQLFTDQGPIELSINGERISIALVSGIKA
jgi:flagellar basal-body rod modification protein FlgD